MVHHREQGNGCFYTNPTPIFANVVLDVLYKVAADTVISLIKYLYFLEFPSNLHTFILVLGQ